MPGLVPGIHVFTATVTKWPSPIFRFSELFLTPSQITCIVRPVPCPKEGRIMIVAKRGAGCGGRGNAVARFMRADERRCCGRRSRVVLTPRRWRQVPGRLTLLGDDGGKKARSPGRARISRKAIAQGRPECFRFTCMLVCAFPVHQCTRDRGCSAHPVFPAPSFRRGANEMANLGQN